MKIASWFETKKRGSGEAFSTLKDDAPVWLTQAVRAAHYGDLPNDWIYAECHAACDAIDRGDLKDEDGVLQHADSRVDVYTRALFGWATEMCSTTTWAIAEEAADEGCARVGCEERIRAIQFCSVQSIAMSVLGAAQEQAGEERGPLP